MSQEKFPYFYGFVDRNKIYLKYLIAGGTAAATDLGLLFIFTELLGFFYLVSAVLAFCIAFFVSFYLQKFWTFRDPNRDQMPRQMAVYLTVALVNLGLNTLGMYVLVGWLGIWYLLAQVIIGSALALESFIIYNFVIFNKIITAKNSEKKRLLIATGIYPPDIGGPATYTKILQAELPKHGFEVKVVTYGEGKNNDSVYYISREFSKIIRYLKYASQVWKLIPWTEVVYAQGPVSEGLPMYWACKLRRKPYILKIVGDYAWEQFQLQNANFKMQNFVTLDEFQNKKFDAKTERKRRVEKKVARNAQKIITPSQYLKKIVKQWGVSEGKIEVIYNTINFQNVTPAKKADSEKWLVTVARLVPWKGMEALIEVMPELLKTEKNLKLNIIGDGPLFEKLKLKIDNLEMADSIRLLGKLSHDETLGYLKAADIFVLNTGYEGLPHTVIEAMQAGVPVVATKVGGNPEVIENNKTGLLVEYNNRKELARAIITLLSDEVLRKNMSANAQENLDRFSKDKMIQSLIKELSL
ncbi:MAG: glycosyltransferase [bacterium]|nr:glycosyltransferase [bacterium]